MKELDVPHWARLAVQTYRTSLKMPAAVTDRMIFARLVDCYGMPLEQEMQEVKKLIDEQAANS